MKKLLRMKGLKLDAKQKQWLEENNLYVGDVHNHCGISYGYGSLERAIAFASQQLDFFSVTGHFAWPDISKYQDMAIPGDVVAYHKEGFAKLRRNWPEYMRLMNEANNKDLVSFYSYEYHSFDNGDYTVLAKELNTLLPEDPKEGEYDTRLNKIIESNDAKMTKLLAFPHHIGYKTGYRGINWKTYNEKTSPLVEILSMHGSAESYEAQLKYLHTMGPKSGNNTMRGGLNLNNHFGVMANTDHHNASPGSYGFGRTGVYSAALNREGIWDNLLLKKTCAFSGDPIEMALFANDKAIGETLVKGKEKVRYEVLVSSYDRIESLDLIENGKIVKSYKAPNSDLNEELDGYIPIAIGWGKKNSPCSWKVNVEIIGAEVIEVSPRLRGKDMVDPLDIPKENGELPLECKREGNKVYLQATTDGNKTATTNSTQGFVLHTKGEGKVKVSLLAEWRGETLTKEYEYDIKTLFENAQSEYLEGFVSPSFVVGPFVNIEETECQMSYESDIEKGYAYIRCQEANGDIAVSSPIWIE